MSAVKQLNEENFNAETSSGVVLVDFWAPWCGPCKMMLPVLEQIAAEIENVKVCKVNVDESSDLAARFAVRSIPALFILKNGQILSQYTGVQDKNKLLAALRDA